jgi:tripartite-type tricarboxylate transporter receptor subunit TctC
MIRIFLLPGGVTKDQAQFYVDLLHKVTETPEWKAYLERNALTPAFISGDALTAFLTKDEQKHEAIMKQAGFLAKK